MMMLGYISGGLTVLILICVVVHNIGYEAGYKQATKDVREWVKKGGISP